MSRHRRRLVSIAVGVVFFVGAYVFLFPTACAEVLGVSSWDRCTSVAGNPAFSVTDRGLDSSLDILIPLLVALVGAAVAWWLGGTGSIRE